MYGAAEQVVEAPGANVVTGQVTAPAFASVTTRLSIVTWLVFVTRNVYDVTAPTVIDAGPVLVSDSDSGVTDWCNVQVIAAPATSVMSSEPVNGASVGRLGCRPFASTQVIVVVYFVGLAVKPSVTV